MKNTNITNITAEIQALKDQYLYWIWAKIDCPNYGASVNNYSKLLVYLLSTTYSPIISMDENRKQDGLNLVRQFYYETTGNINGPWYPETCSILEMLLALSIRAEDIMEDPESGSRMSIWFWRMIDSLGSIQQDDKHFNPRVVTEVIERFLKQEYLPNGSGGLFTLPGCPVDLRKIEIWEQMIWYLDRVIDNEQH